MALSSSGSGLDSDRWLRGECEEGPGPLSSEAASLADGWLLSGWLLWLLFIMLFMAFCISSSMRCFSRLGIRPKRTAEEHRHGQLTDYNRPTLQLRSVCLSISVCVCVSSYTCIWLKCSCKVTGFIYYFLDLGHYSSWHSQSLDMPTSRHFLKRHCWHRFLLMRMMGQLSFLRHFLY